jgi:hypothetical protein
MPCQAVCSFQINIWLYHVPNQKQRQIRMGTPDSNYSLPALHARHDSDDHPLSTAFENACTSAPPHGPCAARHSGYMAQA